MLNELQKERLADALKEANIRLKHEGISGQNPKDLLKHLLRNTDHIAAYPAGLKWFGPDYEDIARDKEMVEYLLDDSNDSKMKLVDAFKAMIKDQYEKQKIIDHKLYLSDDLVAEMEQEGTMINELTQEDAPSIFLADGMQFSPQREGVGKRFELRMVACPKFIDGTIAITVNSDGKVLDDER